MFYNFSSKICVSNYSFYSFYLKKISKQKTVKYYSESEFAKEPYQATEDSAGYDLLAAETKTFLPKSVGSLSIDLRWAIPPGFMENYFHVLEF